MITASTAVLAALLLAGCGASDDASTAANTETLMNPTSAEMTQKAPDTFRARFETTKGTFVIDVERNLAPHGADRFYNLVRNGYYNGNKFFRVLSGFVVQWGAHGDPELTLKWHTARIPDDPVKTSNEPGTITFATSGKNSRTTQLFINYGNNTNLDSHPNKFAPFGRVVEGMDVVESLNGEYGSVPQNNFQQIAEKGNAFLEKHFPNLDAIITATID